MLVSAISILAGLVVGIISNQSLAGYEGPMDTPLGISSIFELHVVKNDGMDTHIKWRCDDIDSCFEALNALRHKDSKLENCKTVWFEKLGEKLTIK